MAPRQACATCPWRKTTPRSGFPGGSIDGAELRRMSLEHELKPGPMVMECHSGQVHQPKACVGFAAVIGRKSLGFRLAQALDLIDQFNPDPTPFHPSVDALLSFHPDCSADKEDTTDNG